METISGGTLLECGLILLLLAGLVGSMQRKIGIDTHGSLGQWLAALAVGGALAAWVLMASPEQFLTADALATASPYSSPLMTAVAGAATAWALLMCIGLMLLFDKQMGPFLLYRVARVFGRGFVLMLVILTGIRIALTMAGTRVVW